MMASMTPNPAACPEFMRRADTPRPFKFAAAYSLYGRYDEESAAQVGPSMPALDMQSTSYRICLDCALPLATSEQSREAECRCLLDEESEDGWLALSGIEIAFILSLVAACLVAAFWL